MISMEEGELAGTLRDFGEIRLINVCGTKDEPLWNEMIDKYHYLGLGKIIGPRLKYLALHEGAAIGAIGFNRASKSIGARERYIGWNYKQRTAMLKRVVNNTRFLILPRIRIKNMASHILSKAVKKLRVDWEAKYGEKPCVVETIVNSDLYKGTCYLAANWQYLGETRGYGKVGSAFVYHGQKKKVFAYVLDKRFVAQMRKENPDKRATRDPECPTLKKKARRECMMMIQTMADWNPTLLSEAGVDESSVEGLGNDLMAFLDGFEPGFARSEGRENFAIMIKGTLSDLQRKSIEPIALRYVGAERVRALQVFMGAPNAVDDNALRRIYQERLADAISDEGGMLNTDGSDMPKKGKKSVGVARQHCGALGKVENCQAGVFIGYASDKGYGLVGCRLYMPESWMGEENKERRDECHVPEGLEFKTKVELAAEMIDDAVKTGLFKVKWIGADSFFGRNKDFLRNLPEGTLYFADILFNMKVFPLAEPAGSGIAASQSVMASEVAEDENIPWERIILAEGSKGPIITEEKCVRVFDNYSGKHGNRKGVPGGELWLYIRKFPDGKVKYALSDAPSDTPITELRRAATLRWPIEQCFEECKDDLGMDHYEGRSWTLWHRHMLFVFIAHLFLLELRLRFKKKLQF